jgi:hypothetical protein
MWRCRRRGDFLQWMERRFRKRFLVVFTGPTTTKGLLLSLIGIRIEINWTKEMAWERPHDRTDKEIRVIRFADKL